MEPGLLSHRQEWLLCRVLLRDLELRTKLFAAIDGVNQIDGQPVVLDLGLLRVLETCLLTLLHDQ